MDSDGDLFTAEERVLWSYEPGVVTNSDPCQIITPLVLVGLGLGVGEGLGLGNQIAISMRGVIIWQGVENGHNTDNALLTWPVTSLQIYSYYCVKCI